MFDKGFAEREKEMIGEAGALGLTGPDDIQNMDESELIARAGERYGAELGRTQRTEWTDNKGRKLSFEIWQRLPWFWWIIGVVLVAGMVWAGMKAV